MAAKKPTKSATPTTVTLKHLAAAIAESHEMPKKQSEAILGDMVGLVVKHLKKGERIRIGGLGILVVRKRAARMGRNPLPRRQGAQGSGLARPLLRPAACAAGPFLVICHDGRAIMACGAAVARGREPVLGR